MATITKTPAGTFRAIIRTKNKTITKTFKLRKLAKAWALRIEGDEDLMAATGCKGASIPFTQLADEYIDQWTGKSRITDKVRFWKMQLGDTPLIKITGDQLQTILDDYEAGKPCVVSSAPGQGVSAHLQPSSNARTTLLYL